MSSLFPEYEELKTDPNPYRGQDGCWNCERKCRFSIAWKSDKPEQGIYTMKMLGICDRHRRRDDD